MLPLNQNLQSVRDCYGKKWGAADPDCVGGPGVRPCALQDCCRLEIAHQLVAPRQLIREAPRQAPAPSPPRTIYTPPGPSAPIQPAAMTRAPQTADPLYRPAQPQAATPVAQPYQGSMPLDVRGATLIPHATHTPAALSVPESRAPGRKIQSFFSELVRAAFKGAATQAANFADEVPFDPLDPRSRK